MQRKFLNYLVDPHTKEELDFFTISQNGENILEGLLINKNNQSWHR